jgi:hypothetical protein
MQIMTGNRLGNQMWNPSVASLHGYYCRTNFGQLIELSDMGGKLIQSASFAKHNQKQCFTSCQSKGLVDRATECRRNRICQQASESHLHCLKLVEGTVPKNLRQQSNDGSSTSRNSVMPGIAYCTVIIVRFIHRVYGLNVIHLS